MAARKSPRAICPHTRLTIPECSCDRCLEDLIRRFMPALLEREGARRQRDDPVLRDDATTGPPPPDFDRAGLP